MEKEGFFHADYADEAEAACAFDEFRDDSLVRCHDVVQKGTPKGAVSD